MSVVTLALFMPCVAQLSITIKERGLKTACGMAGFIFLYAFLVGFISCLVVTIYVFNNLRTGTDAYWMLPLMGFATLGVFAGYAIYFPELFPTRLRSTGTSFCYNVGRFIAASGPFTMGVLATRLSAGATDPAAKLEAFRSACCWMSAVFLVGLVAVALLPETKGQPLPED